MIYYIIFIQDREHPQLDDASLSELQIDAKFAVDSPEFDVLNTYSGVDGFMFNTEGLYSLNSGHQWFLQVNIEVK